MTGASVYYYLHHEPDARLSVEALEGGGGPPWLIVRGAGEAEATFTLGLSSEQARDFARKLFVGAAGVDALEAQAAAQLPQAAP